MDQYEKGPIIGYGTYGSVYRATHKTSGEVVALKKLRVVGNADTGVAQVRHYTFPIRLQLLIGPASTGASGVHMMWLLREHTTLRLPTLRVTLCDSGTRSNMGFESM